MCCQPGPDESCDENDPTQIFKKYPENFGLGNNYLSIAGLNWLSGDTLDSEEKTLILNRLENSNGLSFRMNGQAALPAINFASGNMAITSNLMYFSSYTMPAGMARLILEGNANNPNIDMTFTYEIMAVNETAFSFAIPFILSNYWILLITTSLLIAIASWGLNIVSGYAGQVNLGHGVLPETKPEMVELLVNTVKDFK